MSIGKRDRRISIEVQTMGRGVSGGMVPTWTEFVGAWAAVRNVSGSIAQATGAGGGQQPQARTEFTIAYRAGITDAMRVRYAGKVYAISHVNDWMEKHDRTVLTCDMGASDA